MGAFEVGLNEFCIMILLQDYEGQGMDCGRLNVIGLLKLIWSGTIRSCDCVGMGMALFERNETLWGLGFRFTMLRIPPRILVYFLLPAKCSTLSSSSSTTSAYMLPCFPP